MSTWDSTLTLPLELLYRVLDHIPDAPISTIKSCTLVCKAFHSSCRKRIFSRITLTFYQHRISLPGYRELREMMASSPNQEIGHSTRRLRLGSYPMAGGSDPDAFDEECKLVASILPDFHNIQALYLCGAFPWDRMTPCLKHALVQCFLTNPITYIQGELGKPGFPLSLLNCCSHLKGLDYYQRRISTPNAPGVPSLSQLPQEKIRLESLDVLYRAPLEWIFSDASRLDTSHIESLVWRPEMYAGLARLLDFSSTLQNLILRVIAPDITPSLVSDLERLPHLKRLALETGPFLQSSWLKSAPRQLALWNLEFLRFNGFLISFDLIIPDRLWDRFDRLLAELPSLQIVELGDSSSSGRSDAVDGMRKRFPRLSSRVEIWIDVWEGRRGLKAGDEWALAPDEVGGAFFQ